MVDKAVRFGMDELELSGGEPLVVEKDTLLDVIRYASGKEMVATVSTNTWFLNEGYAYDLKDAGLDRLKTSLYGTSPRSHEAFTGREGSYERLMRVLGILRDLEIETWVNYIVTPRNLDETCGLSDLLEPYGIDTMQVSVVIPTGRGRSAEGCLFRDRELYGVVKRLRAILPDSRHSNVSFTVTLYDAHDRLPFEGRYCDYLTDRLVVDPAGRVLPCCVLPQDLKPVLGSLLEEDLPELLTRRRLDGHPIFHWLVRGHEEMEERLGVRRTTPNLCSACMAMLRELVKGREGVPG
jgi:MoaA/NifB/PqqE/SkfB family radical SAM enzyme